MIDCQEADVLAAAMSVGSLVADEQQALQGHLTGCANCRRVAAEYMAAAGLLSLAAEPMRPSPELRSRLMRAVYREAAQAERPRREPFLRRLTSLVPRGRGFAVLAGAAAGVAIGVGSMAGITHRGSPGPSSSLAITLTGQKLAPGAHGQLHYDRNLQVGTVMVTGLPSPSQVSTGGAVYELWLIPASGDPVPAAYLTRSLTGGDWTAMVQGDLSHYSSVAATIEPAGGSRTPTGAEVIEGTLSAS